MFKIIGFAVLGIIGFALALVLYCLMRLQGGFEINPPEEPPLPPPREAKGERQNGLS